MVVDKNIFSLECGYVKSYSISFFGHRRIDDVFTAELELEKIVQKLLCEKEYVEFLVGRDGEFDQIVSSVVRRCKRMFRDDNSSLVWIMPYPTAEFINNEESFRNYYDEIEVCHSASTRHFKAAFKTRNQCMVDRSDLVVFYINHKSGGAYQAMQYAQKRGKAYINIYGGRL